MGASFVLAPLSTADGFRDSGDDFPNGSFLDTVLPLAEVPLLKRCREYVRS